MVNNPNLNNGIGVRYEYSHKNKQGVHYYHVINSEGQILRTVTATQLNLTEKSRNAKRQMNANHINYLTSTRSHASSAYVGGPGRTNTSFRTAQNKTRFNVINQQLHRFKGGGFPGATAPVTQTSRGLTIKKIKQLKIEQTALELSQAAAKVRKNNREARKNAQLKNNYNKVKKNYKLSCGRLPKHYKNFNSYKEFLRLQRKIR